MAGIYVHIPFCRKACHYCNYHFSTNQKLRSAMVNAIVAEWEMRAPERENLKFDSLYFGGGTPSILTIEELSQIIEVMEPVSQYTEVTLEANPDDINEEKLAAWLDLGINRLSLGIQSFHQRQLDWMGRIHTAEESHSSLERIFKSGFENITIDLIYGMSEQSLADWESELVKAFEYPINHLSAYQLTIEEKTALKYDIDRGKYVMPEDELVTEQFDLLMDWMEERDWEHYEISNFSRKGFRALHNSQYWTGEPYIGLGPGAHSYDGKVRSWNVSNNMKFIRAINAQERPSESEFITEEMHYNEWLLTGLRCLEGLQMDELRRFPVYLQEYFLKSLEEYEDKQYLMQDETSVRLNRAGKHFADRIASDFMYV